MTRDKILEKLQELLIITQIGEEYFLTIEHTELRKPETKKPVGKSKIKAKNNEETLKDEQDTHWPFEIQSSKGMARAEALMNAAKIPATAGKGYRLRGLDTSAVKVIDRMVDRNPKINAAMLITEIEYYYKNQEYPKTFKRLVIEGDVIAMYNEAVDRDVNGFKQFNPSEKPNQTWG